MFKEILPSQIDSNLFSAINDDWMLVTAQNSQGQINTMTASWGGFGIIWNKPVCVCVIRPQRYTNEFVKDSDIITFSFLCDGHREALKICGSKSGRDCDKIGLAGLSVICEENAPYFEESNLVVIGRKIYADRLREESFIDISLIEKNYPKKDYHDVYVCEIEKVLIRK